MTELKEMNILPFVEDPSENRELNKIYQLLDPSWKKEFDQLEKKDVKARILKILLDPGIMELYKSQSAKNKEKLDGLNIRERATILKQLLDKINKEQPQGKKFLTTVEKEKEKESTSPKENLTQIPEEILEKSVEEWEEESMNIKPSISYKKDNTSPQQAFDHLVKIYYQSNPYVSSSFKNDELEVRFGTRGIKYLTKNDYDNVIKKLKSLGFNTINANGEYRLTIQNEFLDKNTGKFVMDRNTRTEIYGLAAVQSYCRNNNINELLKVNPNSVKFTKKELVLDEKKNKLFPVNFDDFNFRVSYQIENTNPRARSFIIQNWTKTKKTFRYINRVTFAHADFPVNVDLSIVKNSERDKKYYTLDESELFEKPEIYEIELEMDNKKIGPGTTFNNYVLVLDALRKTIKFVLSGLQGTNYPVSYPEQKEVLHSYMKLLNKVDYNPQKPVYPNQFIGPSSFTLQMENIEPLNENSNIPNIRKDFTVTDKADGERHLMYIHNQGKIYLINTNMDVVFSGAKTQNEELWGSLLDGELIYHDKQGQFINLYAAFDLYYYHSQDVRAHPFLTNTLLDAKEKERGKTSRYSLLKKLIVGLNSISIVAGTSSSSSLKEDQFKKIKESISPIRIKHKNFYPENMESGNIFRACDDIMQKVNNGLFEYNTDGLIFTPAFLGVGSDKIGEAGPLSKITWNYSFKWKPPKYNTIDFLVNTVKAANGTDLMKPIFEEGTNVHTNNQLTEYKMIQLKCTYSEKKHGTIYLNPCLDIIEDKLPEFKVVNYEDKNTNDAQPMQFYPVKPYDPEAGITNIMLRKDDNNTNQMFTEENEVFEDNTIVEFSYDLTRESGWRWIPLRVRYDKTAELRQGMKNFGNAYHVANSNWKSIHNPVTEDMITTGLNIPEMNIDDDIYYNSVSGSMKTQSMKDFHNLFVKKRLIKSVSKKGDTLIDYACGKAGDLPKWIHANLSFVFGLDISKDNLENRLDGACVRYLESRKRNKNMPYALFVNGNSAFNIRSGAALLNDKAAQITKAVFGSGPKEEDILGKGVLRQYGKGQEGFNISSIQFAIHYFFENPDTLQGFMRNISECTKIGGYFIGTSYDGKSIFQLLRKKQPGESVQIIDSGKKIWELTKGYNSEIFEDNSSSIGYRIDVFQESINQVISEYLVNYDYLNRVMEDYGFQLLNRDEAKEFGLPEGSGLFSELFLNMLEDIKRNPKKKSDYGTAEQMSAFEKKISFLNRYFVYKKIRNVNTEKVQLDLGEYHEMEEERDTKETRKAVEVANDQQTKKEKKTRVRKLNKKIVLEPSSSASASEAIISVTTEPIKEKKKRTKKESTEEGSTTTKQKTAKKAPTKKKLILLEETTETETKTKDDE
jgi:hypothetical protein